MPFNFDGIGILVSIAAGTLATGACAIVLVPVGIGVAYATGSSLLVGANIGAGVAAVLGASAGFIYHQQS